MRAPRVYENGGRMRDFIHVHNIAAANLAAIDRLAGSTVPSGGEVMAGNVFSGDPHSVGQLAIELALAMGGPPPEVVGGGRSGACGAGARVPGDGAVRAGCPRVRHRP